MNQDVKYEELLATRWIRELDERELERLNGLFREKPELRARWDEDLALLDGVNRLPEIPVASNFTNQVMTKLAQRVGAAVESKAKPEVKSVGWLERLGLVPRLGLGFGLALAVFASFWQYKQGGSAKLVESLAAVTESDSVPSVEELQHFEAIQMLAQVPVDVDWELIAATE